MLSLFAKHLGCTQVAVDSTHVQLADKLKIVSKTWSNCTTLVRPITPAHVPNARPTAQREHRAKMNIVLNLPGKRTHIRTAVRRQCLSTVTGYQTNNHARLSCIHAVLPISSSAFGPLGRVENIAITALVLSGASQNTSHFPLRRPLRAADATHQTAAQPTPADNQQAHGLTQTHACQPRDQSEPQLDDRKLPLAPHSITVPRARNTNTLPATMTGCNAVAGLLHDCTTTSEHACT
jgi:hypothetical protein